uniref:Uncharacterized protein n=1 Tax=Romanomermis culicivorax TaxID=13658 RepID=A0A915J499_ROMCU
MGFGLSEKILGPGRPILQTHEKAFDGQGIAVDNLTFGRPNKNHGANEQCAFSNGAYNTWRNWIGAIGKSTNEKGAIGYTSFLGTGANWEAAQGR